MEARSAFTWIGAFALTRIGVFAVTRVGAAASKRPDHRSLLRAQVTGVYSPMLPAARSALRNSSVSKAASSLSFMPYL